MATLKGERWDEQNLRWTEKPKPQEVTEALEALENEDTEGRHSHGDAILVATLRACGYTEAADVFASWDNWYA